MIFAGSGISSGSDDFPVVFDPASSPGPALEERGFRNS